MEQIKMQGVLSESLFTISCLKKKTLEKYNALF